MSNIRRSQCKSSSSNGSFQNDKAYWSEQLQPIVFRTSHRKKDYATILSVLRAVDPTNSENILTHEEACQIPYEAGQWFLLRESCERIVVRLGFRGTTSPGLKKFYWRTNSSKRLLKREMKKDEKADLIYIIQNTRNVSKRCASIPGTEVWLVMYIPAASRKKTFTHQVNGGGDKHYPFQGQIVDLIDKNQQQSHQAIQLLNNQIVSLLNPGDPLQKEIVQLIDTFNNHQQQSYQVVKEQITFLLGQNPTTTTTTHNPTITTSSTDCDVDILGVSSDTDIDEPSPLPQNVLSSFCQKKGVKRTRFSSKSAVSSRKKSRSAKLYTLHYSSM